MYEIFEQPLTSFVSKQMRRAVLHFPWFEMNEITFSFEQFSCYSNNFFCMYDI